MATNSSQAAPLETSHGFDVKPIQVPRISHPLLPVKTYPLLTKLLERK